MCIAGFRCEIYNAFKFSGWSNPPAEFGRNKSCYGFERTPPVRRYMLSVGEDHWKLANLKRSNLGKIACIENSSHKKGVFLVCTRFPHLCVFLSVVNCQMSHVRGAQWSSPSVVEALPHDCNFQIKKRRFKSSLFSIAGQDHLKSFGSSCPARETVGPVSQKAFGVTSPILERNEKKNLKSIGGILQIFFWNVLA